VLAPDASIVYVWCRTVSRINEFAKSNAGIMESMTYLVSESRGMVK